MSRLQFFLVFLLTLSAPFAWSQSVETARIEALIAKVEGLEGARFIRNGSEYDAKSAAKFLRAKWERDDSIKTAADFIAKAATGSSTSGKPYLIRFKDGVEVNCATYLDGELKKMIPKSDAPSR